MPQEIRAAVIGSTGRGDYGHGIDVVWKDIPQATLVAVADDNPEGLAKAAQRLGVSATYSNYEEMLDTEKPDVVSICPRWVDQHLAMVLAAANRGIHIYMEKPLCRTLAEADAMVAACQATNTKVALAHQTRYSPKLPVIRQLLEDGVLGNVLEYRLRGKEDHRGGAEDLWVLGTHLMDLLRAIAGDPYWCMGYVQQDGKPVTKEHVHAGNEGLGPLAGNRVEAMYGLDHGQIAHFGSVQGAGQPKTRFGLSVLGTGGIMEIQTGYLPNVRILKGGSWTSAGPNEPWESVSSAGIGVPEPLEDTAAHGGNLLAVQDLLAAVAEDRQPEGGLLEARAATEMIVAVFESHVQGRRVDFPLKTRENPLTLL